VRTFAVVAAILFALMGVVARDVDGQGNPQAAESFVLSGVISFDGGGGLAWLQEPRLTNNQVVAVRRGDNVGPYRLTEIFQDRVELEGPGGKILVPLFSAQAAAAPQTAAMQTAATPDPTPPALASLQRLLRQQQPEGEVIPQERIQRLQEQIVRPSQEQLQPLQEQVRPLQELLQPSQRQAQQQVQASPQQPQPSAEQTRGPQPSMSAASPVANNPNVIFVPMEDPRRTQGLGALLELGRR
jgi:hypothetical protein